MRESLEDMIRRRQDELRGRPEDWIDRLCYRWRTFDLGGHLFGVLIGIGLGLSLALLGWSAFDLVGTVLSCR